MSFNYGSISGLNGKENPGGLGQKIYYAPISYFTTIEKPDSMSAATAAGDVAEISAAHAFAATKFFHTIYNTQLRGKGTFKSVGEVDASGGFYEVEVFIPGTDVTTQGLLRKLRTEDLLFLLPMADDETVHQIGSELFPAKMMEYEFGTADNGAGQRGTVVKLRAFQLGPINYTGAIVTS